MIYLDNAAATPVSNEVQNFMTKNSSIGNPSSAHAMGISARDVIREARGKIGENLNVSSGDKIVFTSGGTESVNLAIFGAARANKDRGKHIITSKIEHPAVHEACAHLEKEGFSVTYLNVDGSGLIKIDELLESITPDTIMISIMYVNNEVGTIQPIKEISEVACKNGIIFHTDACQAGGLELDVLALGVDLMTLNGGKIYGPRGVGLLFVKKGISIEPIIHGGGQEYGLRSGTENAEAIAGFSKALELSQKEKDIEHSRLKDLRDLFCNKLRKVISGIRFNGDPALPNIINVSIPKVDGEQLVKYLSEEGIYVSAGSACTSNTQKISHVLLAMGLNEEEARSSIRFSLGKFTTKEDIEKVLDILPRLTESLSKLE